MSHIPGFEEPNSVHCQTVEDMIKEFHSRPVTKGQAGLMSPISELHPYAQLCEVTESQLGGTIDGANMLAYGTFFVCTTRDVQEKLYQELKAVWTESTDPIPDMKILETLPWLV